MKFPFLKIIEILGKLLIILKIIKKPDPNENKEL